MEKITIIDTHTHPLVHPSQQSVDWEHTADDYRRRAVPAGIVKAAALVMAPEGDLDLTRTLNNTVIRLAEESGGFFFPVCSVHPRDGADALRELERIRQAGGQWLKLHPNTQSFDVLDPDVGEVVGKAGELGLPVLFDAYAPWDVNQPGKFIQLAMAHPDTRLILAHAHGPGFAALLVHDFMARYPWWPRRIWIDISAAAPLLAGGPFQEQFVWVLRKVGVDRILFGSDYPIDMPDIAVAAVKQLGFTPEELDRIFHRNAEELLNPSARELRQ